MDFGRFSLNFDVAGLGWGAAPGRACAVHSRFWVSGVGVIWLSSLAFTVWGVNMNLHLNQILMRSAIWGRNLKFLENCQCTVLTTWQIGFTLWTWVRGTAAFGDIWSLILWLMEIAVSAQRVYPFSEANSVFLSALPVKPFDAGMDDSVIYSGERFSLPKFISTRITTTECPHLMWQKLPSTVQLLL